MLNMKTFSQDTQKVKLSAGLTAFPAELFDLADTLEILDLSNNKLTELPSDFDRFQKLKILFLSENPFEIFPSILAKCENLSMIGFKSCKIREIPHNSFPPKLRWLILTNNKISHLPAEIGECAQLEKLMLSGNCLTTLPPELAKCRNLALLRIAANKLTKLPDWLLTMPNLAWLAFAGNELPDFQQDEKHFEQIAWTNLHIEIQLGEGASGQIFKAIWLPKQTPIAVKIFKGEVTSDGLPDDEMRAIKWAGRHENLVSFLGEIQAHPQQKKALAFELIPASFTNLGNPPSFDSCSRDVFPVDYSLTHQETIRIAKDIASVCLHLHQKGIIHGDLYAHNILIDKTNQKSLLSDFGAAKRYDIYAAEALLLQKIEVKAFGFLLEDLIHLCAEKTDLAFLITLKEACLNENITERPLFQEIVQHFLHI